jgi:hypothetical protein
LETSNGLKETVANQRNRISKLEADRKATETELKAKLRSAQLTAKENIGSLLARVSGGKNETAKAKRDLLDSSKSLAKALKTGSGSDKKAKALELANALLKNDIAVARSKLKDAVKENNSNRKQIDNQLDAKHQLRLSLAKIDLKKHKLTLSRALEKKRKCDDIHHHRLAEIAAREASSKRVKEMAVERYPIRIQQSYFTIPSILLAMCCLISLDATRLCQTCLSLLYRFTIKSELLSTLLVLLSILL